MQAVLNNNTAISEKLDYLLSDVDMNTKNDVENSIVALGARAVNSLIEKLGTLKGIQRGIVAMSLIRIGDAAKAPLKEFALANKDCRWMADYLLSEI